jgi:hypothetical protein
MLINAVKQNDTAANTKNQIISIKTYALNGRMLEKSIANPRKEEYS